ncbi:MAG: cohesin domain-containing protein, partial [Acutalibacteraceae bacterium]
AAGHTYSTEWTVDAVPTCTGPGSKSHHCQNCDAKADVTVIPATGHRYGGWETVKAPTCTADGSHRRVCADCGDIQTGVVPATGHEWDTVWTVDQPATETADGVKSRHCLHCDARTDLTVIPKVVHVGAWEVVTPATCTEAGLERRVCTDCGQVDTRAIPALGHDWETGWTVDRPATATMPGEQTHHCTRCSERTDVTVIPILGGENARLTVTADTFAAKRGDVVTVSVAVAGLTEENYWNTLTFTLQYDDLQLELLSGEDGETALPGPAMSAKSTMSVNARIGSVKLAIVDGDGQAQNGTIVSLRFRVKDTVAIGETVACQVQTDEFLRTVIENGRPIGKIWLTTPAADTVAWQVSDYTLADIDENGEITAADALMALQGATGKIGLNDVQQSAADVDGSGDVTAADALLILQYATGKINQFARL